MGSRSNVASTSVSAIQSCERTRCISQSPFRSPTCSERLSAKAMNRKPRDHFSCRRFGSILKGGDSLNTRGLAAEVGSPRLPQMPAARCDRETPLSPHGLGRSMWDVVSGAPRGRARVGRRRLQTGRTAYGQGIPRREGRISWLRWGGSHLSAWAPVRPWLVGRRPPHSRSPPSRSPRGSERSPPAWRCPFPRLLQESTSPVSISDGVRRGRPVTRVRTLRETTSRR